MFGHLLARRCTRRNVVDLPLGKLGNYLTLGWFANRHMWLASAGAIELGWHVSDIGVRLLEYDFTWEKRITITLSRTDSGKARR